jgi:protein-disulfide isomerase
VSKRAGRESAAARAAAVRAQQASAERRRNLYVAGAVLGVILLVVGIGFFVQSQRDTTGQTAVDPAASQTTASAGDVQVAAAETYGLGVGNPDAKVKVEIFEDFLCPFCQQYETVSRDQLRQDAADGKAYIVYRPFAFLNEYSARALNAFAVVLNKSGPDVALKFHDLLYENQPSESGTMPDNSWLIQKAVAAGAKAADVTAGINNMVYKQWVINGADAASKRQVTSTPTIFVNGKAIAAAASIDDLLTRTQQQIDDGQ